MKSFTKMSGSTKWTMSIVRILCNIPKIWFKSANLQGELHSCKGLDYKSWRSKSSSFSESHVCLTKNKKLWPNFVDQQEKNRGNSDLRTWILQHFQCPYCERYLYKDSGVGHVDACQQAPIISIELTPYRNMEEKKPKLFGDSLVLDCKQILGAGFKYVLFSPLLGEMIRFD